MQLKPETQAKIKALLARYPQRQATLLPVLHLVQEDFGYLSDEVEELVARELDIPRAAVSEVVTFYTMFYREPIGKYHIMACHNLSCTLMGAEKLIQHLEQRLGVTAKAPLGETTADGRFTLTRVECLGACGEAPMMQINDRYHLHLTTEKIEKILEELP